LQAAAHADPGIQGVLAVAVLDAAAQPDLRQVPLAQSRVLERDSPGRTGELERRDGGSSRATSGKNWAGTWLGARAAIRVVDVVAARQAGQDPNLSATMKNLEVDALPLRDRNSVAERARVRSETVPEGGLRDTQLG
jgi:hypothetical protein